MPTQNENQVVNAVCEYLELRRYFFWRQNTVGVYDPTKKIFRRMPKWSLKGVSDVILLKDETVIFIECKTSKGKLSEVQKVFRYNVTNLGYKYIVATSTDELIDAGI